MADFLVGIYAVFFDLLPQFRINLDTCYLLVHTPYSSLVVYKYYCFVVSKSGKHGHAKARITAVGVLDEKKRIIVAPSHDHIDVPIVDKRNASVLSVTGNSANVMDSETFETFDMAIPEELQGQITEGIQIVYWTVMGDKVMKQIKSKE